MHLARWAEQLQPEPYPWHTQTRWRAALAMAAAAEAGLKVAMLVDIHRRPPEGLRGSQRMWRVVAFVNLFGPPAYFVVGRRPGAQRRS